MTINDAATPRFITRWLETLSHACIEEVAPDPTVTAVSSADLINGFLRHGPLSSDRVDRITGPVLGLLERAWTYGVRDYVFLQDTHAEDNPEFGAYPPHAIAGSAESEMIPEIASLHFAEHFTVIEKDSLHPAVETEFDAWWDERPHLRTAIVIGDCTDLCVNQLAMHLRMRANALGLQDFEVIVPANTVETFDIPDHEDAEPGAAHPGDFFHNVWLYHMASNGIRVVHSIS
jgi:nicotinamidase-related amidase